MPNPGHCVASAYGNWLPELNFCQMHNAAPIQARHVWHACASLMRSRVGGVVLICLLLIALLLTAGCNWIPWKAKPAATKKEATPIEAAATKTDTATKKADAAVGTVATKDSERDAKVKANIVHAREANQANPDGTPKTVVDGDLTVAESHLSDVKPDPAELANRQRDALLVEQGKASEARQNYTKAAQDAQKLIEQLTEARNAASLALQERDTARAAEAAARSDFVRQLEQNRKDNQRALEEAVNAERNRFFSWMGRALVIAGIICILVGAFSAYSSVQAGDIFKAVTRGAVWVLFGLFFFGCAWFMNQWWFKWFMIISGALMTLAVVIMIRINWKDAHEKKAARLRTYEADEAEDTLMRIQDVLDNLPKDDPVFSKLSNAMSDNHKALMHEIKAQVQRSKTIPPFPIK